MPVELQVPAYASGVPLVGSLIWFVGFAATVAMLLAALGWLPVRTLAPPHAVAENQSSFP